MPAFSDIECSPYDKWMDMAATVPDFSGEERDYPELLRL